jgi:inhibitor of KinA
MRWSIAQAPDAMFEFELRDAGDSALLVQLPERIDPLISAWCVGLSRAIEQRFGPAVRDVVIGYCSVTVYFDPLAIDSRWLEQEVKQLARWLDPEDKEDGGQLTVPVCYGREYGPDLAAVASFAACSEAEVIDLHAGATYRVYLVGFVPGFAYMAEVDPRIGAPRRHVPRTAVPPGSVAIAGGQTGIYPSATPGGWNIIGRTPVKPYDSHRAEPFLFKPGDRVRFEPMTPDEFLRF